MNHRELTVAPADKKRGFFLFGCVCVYLLEVGLVDLARNGEVFRVLVVVMEKFYLRI